MFRYNISRPLYILALTVLLSLPVSSCARSVKAESEYGSDALYFEALQKIQKDEFNDAVTLLKKCMKNADPFVARLCSQTLVEVSKDSLGAAKDFYEKFPDDESKEIYLQELMREYKYDDVLKLTEDIDLDNVSDTIIYCRISALQEKKDPAFSKEYRNWCLERPFSSLHYAIYQNILESSKTSTVKPDDIQIFRALVYEKDWSPAEVKAKELVKQKQNLTTALMSDIGKALVNGSKSFGENASLLDSVSEGLSPDILFYNYFYQGRLYDKQEKDNNLAMDRFLKAMNVAPSPELFDNALWYYLNSALKDSIARAIFELSVYRSQWSDPEYFDDFLDTLSIRLLTKHLWQEYYDVAKLIDGYATNETVAKFAYVAGSLIENNFFNPTTSSTSQACKALYQRALHSDTNIYHKFAAAGKLKLSTEEIEKELEELYTHNDFTANPDVEKILNGYVDFELPEYIYPMWEKYQDSVGFECCKKIATYLRDYAQEKDSSYYTLSLRIAAKKANKCECPLDKEILKLTFPRDFTSLVDKYTKEFNLDESLVYAVIRSESYFAPEVSSWAGAVGLMQLMKPTATDIAKKFKTEDFDLLDEETNVKFGTYYISELKERLDGDMIPAICSYNAGIGRVRTLLKNAKLEFERQKLPNDIFLEALPIGETRDYGRKVAGCTAMYSYLYHDKNPGEIMHDLMGWEDK
ncbi:MAG: lytic transglycosylase domain-containing protein [Treponema sp.]|nr:lytic transglycosylase domain-containing protein [Treponema sp.]